MGKDTSIFISVDDITTPDKRKLISQITSLKERIKSFERIYNSDLPTFEDKSRHLPEDFRRWDDFIEWKAYVDSLKDLESKLKR